MTPLDFCPRQIVISCEHASNRLPARYGTLGLTPRALGSHIAWDAGAREIARYSARRLACAYHEGKYSRVLIDLNRSPEHRKLIPKESFGVRVPDNAELTADERATRLERYYEPYRAAVLRDIERAVSRYGTCLHISIHSFAPRLHGMTRNAEFGILYDPQRSLELKVARRLAYAFRRKGFRVRRNFPYRGTSDGLTASSRRTYPVKAYVGLELEVNQGLLRRVAGRRRIRQAVADVLDELTSGRNARACRRGRRDSKSA